MFKLISTNSIAAVALAAVAASLMVGIATPLPEAQAAPVLAQPQAALSAKGDRLPQLLTGAACSARGWPHYEQSCQFDLRQPADALARTVRVIAMR
jgi:hypothetical protein